MSLGYEKSLPYPRRNERAGEVLVPDTDLEEEYSGFFRAEFARVVRAAYLVVHDRARAEDIAQDAFTQLFVRWGTVSRYERPDAWVRRVAIRAAVRQVKRERMRAVLERALRPPPVYEVEAADVDLIRMIRTLPPQQRAAVTLFYFEDRPTSEVAAILGCSESTAKVHLFRARQRLADLLREETLDAP